jgi:hypothetical protein
VSVVPFDQRVIGVARDAVSAAPSEARRREAEAIVARLNGPMRVAIAGRVKAGKSTLLNALVGERLAPTDAGECTRIVTVYERGTGYNVTAHLHNGDRSSLQFSRSDGALNMRLGDLGPDEIHHIEIKWPTTALEAVSLVDTPGLVSANADNSRRTLTFLGMLEDEHGSDAGEADAVVFLMRHAHRTDLAFLDAFMDTSVAAATPVNSVAVLSRADEIGGGRIDAMESSTRIATRYRSDPEINRLCSTVLPVAGLLAETALTLREEEVSLLRALATTDPDVVDEVLLSADHFCDDRLTQVGAAARRALLGRLGMFGIRLALQEVRAGHGSSAAELGPLLLEHSGLPALRDVMTRQFAPRSRVLQARSALVALRALAARATGSAPEFAVQLEGRLERLEAGAVQFAQLRAEHLLTSGSATVSDDHRRQLLRLFGELSPGAALGVDPLTPTFEIEQLALEGIRRWRRAASDPLIDPPTAEMFAIAIRVTEQIYAAVS